MMPPVNARTVGVKMAGLPLPWIWISDLGHPVDISMDVHMWLSSNDWHHKFGINVISACHRMGWLNTRLNYSLDLDLTCICCFIFFVFLILAVDCALYLFSGYTFTQDKHLWIWIYPWISTKNLWVDMDMDIIFHIHGNPEKWTFQRWGEEARIVRPLRPLPWLRARVIFY